jgi:hypothetical protein
MALVNFLLWGPLITAMYLHPASFPGDSDTQTLYASMTSLEKMPFSG